MSTTKSQRASLGQIFTRDFLVLAVVNLSVFFGFQMLNVGLPVYLDQLGATTHLVGLATTLMTVTATAMRVVSGALLDRFGRRIMLALGTGIMVCAIVSFAIFPVVGIILGLRLLHGIGWGVGSTASSTIAADIIPKHRFAEGMGYFAMTTAISSAIAPAVSVALVHGPGSVVMLWVAAGITALALLLTVVEVFVHRGGDAPTEDTPDREGAPGEGMPEEVPPGDAIPDAAQANAAPTTRQPASLLATLFDKRAVLPGMLMLLVNMGFGCITTFIALHAEAQHAAGVSVYFLVYAITTLVSRPYIGRLIDRYGYRAPSVLSAVCTAATLVLIGASANTWMFALSGALGGLGIGTAMGTFQTMAVASVEPWRRGVATSTYMTLFDLGIAAGSLLGGFIAGAAGYAVMYYAIAAFPLAAAALSLAVTKHAPDQR